MPLILQILTIVAYAFSAIYMILIVFFYVGSRKLKQHKLKPDEELPELTIIFCAKDEETDIRATFESVFAQNYPIEKYRVIAVNDRSVDSTAQIMEEYAIKYSNLKIIHIKECPPNVSPKKNAISKAIEQCKTEFIVATDADAVHKKNWLRSYGSLCDEHLGAATGISLFKKDDFTSSYEEVWQSMQTLENLSHNVVIAGAMANGFGITANGSNMLYRKQLFADSSALRSNIVSGDDSDIIFQAQKRGYQVKFNVHPESIVHLVPEESIKGVINQRVRWASKTLNSTISVVLLCLSLFFFYLSTVIFPFLGFIHINMLFYGLGLFLIKALCDIFYMTVTLRKFNIPFKFSHLLLMELVHAPFIIWIGLRGTFGKFTWKGSTYKKTL